MRPLVAFALFVPLWAGADEMLEECVAIDDDAARLACYDEAVGRDDYLDRRPAPTLSGETSQLPPAREVPPPAPAARPVEQPVAEPGRVAATPARAAQKPADDFGLEQQRDDEKKFIRSRLDGEFTGWSGRTLFRLENGQVWRQSEPGRFRTQMDRPLITIERGVFNSYRLKVEGLNRSVRVKRVR